MSCMYVHAIRCSSVIIIVNIACRPHTYPYLSYLIGPRDRNEPSFVTHLHHFILRMGLGALEGAWHGGTGLDNLLGLLLRAKTRTLKLKLFWLHNSKVT